MQIQLVAGNCENEALDRQSLERQLHKVLKELRKARDQITRLETAVSPLSTLMDDQAILALIWAE